MRRLFAVLQVTCVVLCLSIGGGAQQAFQSPQPVQAISLDVAFNPRLGVSEATASRLFPGGAVLTGNFFDARTKALVGLLVVRGKYLHKASGRPNRGVLAQTQVGEIVILTERKAGQLARAGAIRTAVEAAPLMQVGGIRRHYWNDVGSKDFYRPTYRVLVGLTDTGEFFWTKRYGTLGAIHAQLEAELAAKGQTLRDLLNLDGGTTANPTSTRYPPARLIIVPRAVAQREKP